jgi:hypothetical protein
MCGGNLCVPSNNRAYPARMSWVTDRVEEERKASAAMAANQTPKYSPPPPAWLPVWEAIISATQAAVREFNQKQGSEQFRVSGWPKESVHMEVVSLPAAHRVATLFLQMTNEHTGEMYLTIPPEGEGIGRRGKFRMREGKIEALPDFVGQPQPPQTMTPEEFARFMLEPMLFRAQRAVSA